MVVASREDALLWGSLGWHGGDKSLTWHGPKLRDPPGRGAAGDACPDLVQPVRDLRPLRPGACRPDASQEGHDSLARP